MLNVGLLTGESVMTMERQMQMVEVVSESVVSTVVVIACDDYTENGSLFHQKSPRASNYTLP